jgi:hypothetical protein
MIHNGLLRSNRITLGYRALTIPTTAGTCRQPVRKMGRVRVAEWAKGGDARFNEPCLASSSISDCNPCRSERSSLPNGRGFWGSGWYRVSCDVSGIKLVRLFSALTLAGWRVVSGKMWGIINCLGIMGLTRNSPFWRGYNGARVYSTRTTDAR